MYEKHDLSIPGSRQALACSHDNVRTFKLLAYADQRDVYPGQREREREREREGEREGIRVA